MRAGAWTAIAMLAFAGNSILCRLALKSGTIDPASFTSVRLLAGAVTLLLIVRMMHGSFAVRGHGGWYPAAMLFAYALFFSWAYTELDAGTGALILFGFVQGTMIVAALAGGDRPGRAEWLGWLLASAGLAWLLAPGITAPPLLAATMMALAGIAWGLYSLRGRRESKPLAATAANFGLSLAFVAVLTAATADQSHTTVRGLLLAVASGALTSGIGYVIWYRALQDLRAMQAALVQLSVPAIAATGGVLLLDEALSLQLLVSGALILGGISLALFRQSARTAA